MNIASLIVPVIGVLSGMIPAMVFAQSDNPCPNGGTLSSNQQSCDASGGSGSGGALAVAVIKTGVCILAPHFCAAVGALP